MLSIFTTLETKKQSGQIALHQFNAITKLFHWINSVKVGCFYRRCALFVINFLSQRFMRANHAKHAILKNSRVRTVKLVI